MPDRRWLENVLRDIADGTCSVLEHGYLTKVERAHGLPPGRRQPMDEDTSGRVYRDVHYEQYDQYVELDGALFHDSPPRAFGAPGAPKSRGQSFSRRMGVP